MLFGSVLLLSALGAFGQDQSCNPSNVTLVYTPLANAARVAGAVIAELKIQNDGAVTILRIDGPPILIPSARQSLAGVRYPSSCAGSDVRIKFTYTLEEPPGETHETTQTGPGEFSITAQLRVIDHNPH